MVSPQSGSQVGGPLDAASLTELVYAEAPPYASARGPRHNLGERGRSTPRGWPRAESFESDSDFGIAERGWTPRPQPRPEVVPPLSLLGGAKGGLGKAKLGQGTSANVGSQMLGGVNAAPKGRLEKLMEELLTEGGGTKSKVDAAVKGPKGTSFKKTSLGGA